MCTLVNDHVSRVAPLLAYNGSCWRWTMRLRGMRRLQRRKQQCYLLQGRARKRKGTATLRSFNGLDTSDVPGQDTIANTLHKDTMTCLHGLAKMAPTPKHVTMPQ
ncbi:unnamed protein product, partial [Ectocarpus sp. 12 AP-2014]